MQSNNQEPRLIILDGPRGAGKSTVAQLLAEVLTTSGVPAVYFKKTYRSDHDEFTNMVNHLNQFLASPELIVCDRFVATEWVMSTAHQRAEPRKLMDESLEMDYMLRDHQALHLILLPPLETLGRRLNLRGKSGRSWDMAKESIHPLWLTAHAIFKSTSLYENVTPMDQSLLVADVLSHFSVAAAESYKQRALVTA